MLVAGSEGGAVEQMEEMAEYLRLWTIITELRMMIS